MNSRRCRAAGASAERDCVLKTRAAGNISCASTRQSATGDAVHTAVLRCAATPRTKPAPILTSAMVAKIKMRRAQIRPGALVPNRQLLFRRRRHRPRRGIRREDAIVALPWSHRRVRIYPARIPRLRWIIRADFIVEWPPIRGWICGHRVRPRWNWVRPGPNGVCPRLNRICPGPNGVRPWLNWVLPWLNRVRPRWNGICPRPNWVCPWRNRVRPLLNSAARRDGRESGTIGLGVLSLQTDRHQRGGQDTQGDVFV